MHDMYSLFSKLCVLCELGAFVRNICEKAPHIWSKSAKSITGFGRKMRKWRLALFKPLMPRMKADYADISSVLIRVYSRLLHTKGGWRYHFFYRSAALTFASSAPLREPILRKFLRFFYHFHTLYMEQSSVLHYWLRNFARSLIFQRAFFV